MTPRSCLVLVWGLCILLISSLAHAQLRSDPFNPIPTTPWGTNAPGQVRTWQLYEDAATRAKLFGPFVVGGTGTVGTSASLTTAAFATEAYTPERVNQVPAAITFSTTVNDTCWVIVSSQNTTIASWTRVGSTAYYYFCQGNTTPLQPTLPAHSAFLFYVSITGCSSCAITSVTDRRFVNPWSSTTGIYLLNQYATGGDGSSATPWTGWEAAFNGFPENAHIYLPKGVYFRASTLTIKKGYNIRGAGKNATVITSSCTTCDGINSTWPLNSSTAVNLRLEDLSIVNTAGTANTKGGFVDVGGSFLYLKNVAITGFKYGVIFDQSELAEIDLCDIETQWKAGVWLVNGDDHTASALSQFTNRITITRSQFNAVGHAGPAAAPGDTSNIAIIEDGGVTHEISNNNFNGWTQAIRIAGVNGLIIKNNEFEGAVGPPVLVYTTTFHGSDATGVSGSVVSMGNVYSMPGLHAWSVQDTMGSVSFIGDFMSSGSTYKILGAANIAACVSVNSRFSGGTALFDGRCTHHFDTEEQVFQSYAYTGTTNAGALTTISHTWPGAVPGDRCLASHDDVGAKGLLFSCAFPTTGNVNVLIYNPTGSNLTLTGTLTVSGFK